MSEDGGHNKLIVKSYPGGQITTNPLTGEVIDLVDFGEHALITQMDEIERLRGRLQAFKEDVSDELIRRMDQAASWTIREGDWEVSAPSPTAGTTEYLPDALEEVLESLVDSNAIAPSAAEVACKRSIRVELQVPWSADHHKLAERLRGADLEVEGVPLAWMHAEAHTKPSLAGIRALEKVPGCKEALKAARVDVSPPRRKVKVSRKR